MLGIFNKISSSVGQGFKRYVTDGLKLYMPYKQKTGLVRFVGTGSTSFVTDDYIDTGATFQTTFDGSFSVAFWVKPDDLSEERSCFGAKNSGTEDWVHCNIQTSGDITFYYKANNVTAVERTTTASIVANTWAHVCCVIDETADEINVYVDGVLKNDSLSGVLANITMSAFATEDELLIGARSAEGAAEKHFDGSMKNVAIWERALTATEVQNVMYKSYGGFSTHSRLASGLVSWWALDATSLGSELITNGDFSDGKNDWAATEYITALTDDNEISVSAPSTAGGHSYFGTQAGSGFSLVTGKKYQLSFDYALISGVSPKVSITASSYAGTGRVTLYAENVLTKGSISTTFDATNTETNYISFFNTNSNVTSYTLDNVTLKEVQIEDLKGSNEGSIYGATVDEDLYGGDTPVIPRAIDNARTVQADAIGAGSALFVASNTDYISIADSDNLSFGDASEDSAFSISAWVKMTDATSFYIINKGVVGVAHEWIFYTTASDKIAFYAFDESATAYVGRTYDTSLASYENTWIHLAGTYDATEANSGFKIYLNGIQVDDTNFTGGSYTAMEAGASDVHIGRYDSTYVDGNICQVGIWSAVLDQEQIQSIMEKTYEELIASEKEDLVSYWALDETTLGSEMYDKTGGWSASGANDIAYDGLDFVLTHDDSTDGMYSYLSSGIFTSNLTINRTYQLNFDAYSSIGSPVVRIWDGTSFDVVANLTTTSTNYNITVIPDDTSDNYIRFFVAAGGTVTVNNFSFKEVLVEDLEGSNDGNLD